MQDYKTRELDQAGDRGYKCPPKDKYGVIDIKDFTLSDIWAALGLDPEQMAREMQEAAAQE